VSAFIREVAFEGRQDVKGNARLRCCSLVRGSIALLAASQRLEEAMLVERCGQPAGPEISGASRLTPEVSDDHGELVRVSPMVLERCVQVVPIARIGHVREGRLASVDGVIVQMDESIEQQDDILNHPYHGQGSPTPCVKRSACLGEGR
jgi:hypothetical protein